MSKTDTIRVVVPKLGAFGTQLLSRLAAPDANVVFAPLSVAAGLGMIALGARGKSKQLLEDVLGSYGALDELPHPTIRQTSDHEVDSGSDGPVLSWANALWIHEDLKPLSTYVLAVREQYRAPVHVLDFAHGPEGARRRVNHWAQWRTRRRITELLPTGAVTQATRLVLTNALHFEAPWLLPFQVSEEQELFCLPSGQTRPVTILEAVGEFRYVDAGAYQAVDIPYAGGAYSFVAVLPRESTNSTDIPKMQNLNRALGIAAPRPVLVQLPRFAITCAFSLREPLSAAGLESLFSDEADLSGITGAPGLRVDGTYHSAAIDVNEWGSRAAAGTAVVTGITTCMTPERPVVFRADRPFWFSIRENGSGAELFAGQLADPTRE